MPLNERCFSSKFHGYDVISASACAKSLLPQLVEAAAARPPFSACVSCVATACMRINLLRCA